MFSQYTTYLANRLCGGSSRKLIAGWWYSILALTVGLLIMSCMIVGRQRPWNEAFVSIWSGIFLGGLSIVGTMIMRKFHNSIAVGFFMGVTVGSCQWFATLSLVYLSFRHDQLHHPDFVDAYGNRPSAKEETLLAIMAAIQAVLLGSFAAILAAHRSEILDKQHGTAIVDDADSAASYDPPPVHGGRA